MGLGSKWKGMREFVCALYITFISKILQEEAVGGGRGKLNHDIFAAKSCSWCFLPWRGLDNNVVSARPLFLFMMRGTY